MFAGPYKRREDVLRRPMLGNTTISTNRSSVPAWLNISLLVPILTTTPRNPNARQTRTSCLVLSDLETGPARNSQTDWTKGPKRAGVKASEYLSVKSSRIEQIWARILSTAEGDVSSSCKRCMGEVSRGAQGKDDVWSAVRTSPTNSGLSHRRYFPSSPKFPFPSPKNRAKLSSKNSGRS